MRFLREWWPWIVVPLLIVLAALLALVLAGGGEAQSPATDYPVF